MLFLLLVEGYFSMRIGTGFSRQAVQKVAKLLPGVGCGHLPFKSDRKRQATKGCLVAMFDTDDCMDKLMYESFRNVDRFGERWADENLVMLVSRAFVAPTLSDPPFTFGHCQSAWPTAGRAHLLWDLGAMLREEWP